MTQKESIVRRRVAPVVLPNGDTAHVRTLSLDEGVAFDEHCRSLAGTPNAQLESVRRMVLVAACDADGRRLWNDDEANAIGQVPLEVLLALTEAAADLNGLGIPGKAPRRPVATSS